MPKSFNKNIIIPPLLYPILFFGITIFLGSILLYLPISLQKGQNLTWIDSLFTSTSAVCVTGLSVINIGTKFTTFGLTILALLMQVGGLGIMTITSLIFFLWNKRVSLRDKIAVGQNLQHDSSFHFGSFLKNLIICVLIIEFIGAFFLHLYAPKDFTPFIAIFHAISAFCNAGFSTFPTSLTPWVGHIGINLTFIFLISFGGIGFSLLIEVGKFFKKKYWLKQKNIRLSWHTKIILQTYFFFTLAGWIGIYLVQYLHSTELSTGNSIIAALFQSATARTAGFNTVNINMLNNTTLMIICVLMFVGGASGSCAGGIKVNTIRLLWAFAIAQIRGRKQVVVQKYAATEESVNKALLLLFFCCIILTLATFLLCLTEANGPFADKSLPFYAFFEATSAFGTVGLSAGLTDVISHAGKIIEIILMFIGRLGPIIFLAVVSEWQQAAHFAWAEKDMLIG